MMALAAVGSFLGSAYPNVLLYCVKVSLQLELSSSARLLVPSK